jgi:hypothetical protein
MSALPQATLCPRCLRADCVENLGTLAATGPYQTPRRLQLTRPPAPRLQSPWGLKSQLFLIVGFTLGIASLRYSVFFWLAC